MATWTLSVNGIDQTVEAEPNMPLLWALRDLLNLTGTKFGCGVGLCAACTVLVDGEAVRSCLTPVSAVADQVIRTIEGLSTDGLHRVQEAWLAESVSQCGYCQPGKIMTAVALLDKNPRPKMAAFSKATSTIILCFRCVKCPKWKCIQRRMIVRRRDSVKWVYRPSCRRFSTRSSMPPA